MQHNVTRTAQLIDVCPDCLIEAHYASGHRQDEGARTCGSVAGGSKPRAGRRSTRGSDPVPQQHAPEAVPGGAVPVILS
jgi:hypothetical protein